MEILFQYLVLLLLLPLSFAAVLLLQKRGSNLNPNPNPTLTRPPGTSGWPMVGETLNLALEGAQSFISDRMKRYSPQVFRTRLMGETMAVFCGPEGNKFMFTKGDNLLTAYFPVFLIKLFIFPGHDVGAREVSNQARSAVIYTFKPESLKKCIPVMHSSARKHIDRDWAPNEQVKVFPLSKKFIFDLACKLFLGFEDQAKVNILADPFLLLMKGMHSAPIDFPGTAYRRAIGAGIRFRAELLRIITNRRKELEERKERDGRDVLSKMLLQNKDGNGPRFSETEMVHNITTLLVASYETTGTTITFTLKHLAEFPHIYDKVFQEVTAIARTKGPEEVLTWEDIEKMKYSWNVVRETLRVVPPSQGLIREAVTDLTFAGFTIPKGWKTFWSAYTTHKDPHYFPEPEKIDPTRFEGSGPIPYTFVPFGGGPRMCPGKEYARVVTLIYIYNVVTRFKLEKTAPNEKITYDPTTTPTKGLPLRLYPHAP